MQKWTFVGSRKENKPFLREEFLKRMLEPEKRDNQKEPPFWRNMVRN